MIVWVKELNEVLTIKKVEMWIKINIPVRPLISIEDVETQDVIIVSENDADEELSCVCTVVVYEEIFEKISSSIVQEIKVNKDYFYLKNALEHAKKPFINTLITGSSYGLLGIDEGMLSNEVNLSLSSQDLYYSMKGIYEVCNNNPNIKNIVLCCGYYYLWSDMSKTKIASILYRISSAYYQIYRDAHKCTLLPPLNRCLPQSDIFDIEKIMDIYAVSEYQKHCFLQPKDREYYVQKAWTDKSKKWTQLSDDEKKEGGKVRALQHNKSQKHKLTFRENIGLFHDLVSLCMEKKINLIIVVTPGSKYYRDNLWEGFKESFYNVLNDADGVIHLLDLFEDESFVDEDFVDLDHLNEFGAKKMTGAILELLDGLA